MKRMSFAARAALLCVIFISAMTSALAVVQGTWSEVKTPQIADVWGLKALAYKDPGVVWAVGAAEETSCATVLKYEGGAWREAFKPCGGKMRVLHFVDVDLSGPQDGWVVGDDYYVWSDPDRFKATSAKITGGKVKSVPVPVAGFSAKLEGVAVLPGTDMAFAVGGAATKKNRVGLIFKFDGKSWKQIKFALKGGYQWDLKDIDCPTADKCWAVGNIIFPRWADKGQQVQARPQGVNSLLILSYSNGQWAEEQVPTVQTQTVEPKLLKVSFANVNEGLAAGNSVILRYRNGKWEADVQSNKIEGWEIKGLSYPLPNQAFAVGWDLDTKKPLWLERAADGWFRNKTAFDDNLTAVNDVFFLKPNFGWAVGDTKNSNKFSGAAFIYQATH